MDWWVELGGWAGNEKIHGDTAVWGGVKVLTTSPEGESPFLGQVPSVSPNTLSLSYALCPPESWALCRSGLSGTRSVRVAFTGRSGGVPHSTRSHRSHPPPSVLFLCPLPPPKPGKRRCPVALYWVPAASDHIRADLSSRKLLGWDAIVSTRTGRGGGQQLHVVREAQPQPSDPRQPLLLRLPEGSNRCSTLSSRIWTDYSCWRKRHPATAASSRGRHHRRCQSLPPIPSVALHQHGRTRKLSGISSCWHCAEVEHALDGARGVMV